MKKIFTFSIYVIAVFILDQRGYSQCLPPTANDVEVCSIPSGGVSLSATSYNQSNVTYHYWYDYPTGGTRIATTSNGRPYPSSPNYVSSLKVSTPKTYYVSAACGSSESSRTPVTLSLKSVPDISFNVTNAIGNPLVACQDDPEVKLSAFAGSGFSWKSPDGTVTTGADVYPKYPGGTYTLSGKNSCNTPQTKSVTITFKPKTPTTPTFASSSVKTRCKTTTSSIYEVTTSNANRVDWSINPSTAGQLSPNFKKATVTWNTAYTGTAQITATAFGCMDDPVPSSINVTYTSPPLAPNSNSVTKCKGVFTISATSNDPTIIKHVWYNSSNQYIGTKNVVAYPGSNYISELEVSHTQPGTYTYYVTALSNRVSCSNDESSKATITLNVISPSSIQISYSGGNISAVCEGDSDFKLIANGGSNYQWRRNTAEPAIGTGIYFTPTESGTYYLTGTNNCGDPITTSRSVTVIPKTPFTPNFTLKETSFCQGHQSSNYRVEASNAYSYVWSVSPLEAGEVTFNSTNATVTWNTDYSGTAQVTAKAFGCDGVTNRSSSVTVTINPIVPLYPPQVNSLATCVGGTLSLSATSYNDPSVTGHIWYTSPTGNETITPTQNGRPNESINFCTSGLTQIFTSNVTYYVAAIRNDGTCGEDESVRVPVSFTVVPNPTAPLIDASSILKIPANTATILKITGGENYKWFDQSGMEVYRGNKFYTSNLSETTTYSVCTYAPDAPSCESSRKTMTVTVYHVPKVIAGADQKLALSTGTSTTSVTLPGSATDADGSIVSYSWEKFGGAATLSGINSQSLTANGMAKGTYIFRLTATDNEGYAGSDEVEVTVIGPEENYNYIRETIVLEEGKTQETQLSSLTVDQKSVATTYFDGLGREMQKVSWQSSPLKKDLVQPRFYDRFGRDSLSYLPYTISNTGFYRPSFQTEQSAFYSASNDKVINDNFPFAIPVYESSPLNRVMEQGAPGAIWQPGGKTIKVQYEVNLADEVKQWTINTSDLPEAPSNYLQGELTLTQTTDEKGALIKEYKDKEGRVVLMRRQAEADLWMDTYYIYDIQGNLRYVLPPECVAQWPELAAGTDAHLNLWAFRYKYDARKRMIEKKVPGAGRVVMVYDVLDRLVLSQDAVQSKKDQWMYTKYDELGRPVMTGLYTDNRTIDVIREEIEDQEKLYEDPATTGHGYTQGNCYPKNPSNADVLTVTYYDDYRFLSQSWFEETAGRKYNYYTGKTGYPSSYNTRIKGQVTGQKVKVLGENQWLNSVSYYDKKYRVIRTIAENALEGADTVSMSYDFVGKVQTTRSEQTGLQSTVTSRRYEYDHSGRLEKLWYKVDNGEEVLLAENKYNELGQLIDKGIGVDVNTSTPVQSIDYRYNIRGWLTNINKSDLSKDSDGEKNDDNTDLFGMELLYEQDELP